MSPQDRAGTGERSEETGAEAKTERRPAKPGLELRGKYPAGRDPRRMTREELREVGHERMSPLQALRARCLDCCGDQPMEWRSVRRWVVRPGPSASEPIPGAGGQAREGGMRPGGLWRGSMLAGAGKGTILERPLGRQITELHRSSRRDQGRPRAGILATSMRSRSRYCTVSKRGARQEP
jgi:hypothetical protein